jgi:hypothetical protein
MVYTMKTLQSRIIISMLSMVAFAAMLSPDAAAQTGAWLTPSHDAQHSAVSSVKSQALKTIHWSVPVDLAPPARLPSTTARRW